MHNVLMVVIKRLLVQSMQSMDKQTEKDKTCHLVQIWPYTEKKTISLCPSNPNILKKKEAKIIHMYFCILNHDCTQIISTLQHEERFQDDSILFTQKRTQPLVSSGLSKSTPSHRDSWLCSPSGIRATGVGASGSQGWFPAL